MTKYTHKREIQKRKQSHSKKERVVLVFHLFLLFFQELPIGIHYKRGQNLHIKERYKRKNNLTTKKKELS